MEPPPIGRELPDYRHYNADIRDQDFLIGEKMKL